MNIEENKALNEQNKNENLCVSCKLFYGNEAFGNMCSQCYKKNDNPMTPPKKQKKKEVEGEEPKVQSKKDEQKPQQQKKVVNKERCLTCNRKLKLLGIECKCGYFFCNHHRLPEDHSCGFNHKELAKQRLVKQVVKVEKGKIEQI